MLKGRRESFERIEVKSFFNTSGRVPHRNVDNEVGQRGREGKRVLTSYRRRSVNTTPFENQGEDMRSYEGGGHIIRRAARGGRAWVRVWIPRLAQKSQARWVETPSEVGPALRFERRRDSVIKPRNIRDSQSCAALAASGKRGRDNRTRCPEGQCGV